MKLLRLILAALVASLFAGAAHAELRNPTGVFGTANQITCTPNYGKAVCSLASPLTTPGAVTIPANGAASTPALLFSGSVFTGGTGTTNFPQLLIQPTGATAATGWSTSGTAIGVNLPTGFSGQLMDLRVAGATKFRIDQFGNFIGVDFVGTGSYTGGSTGYIGWQSRAKMSSPADGSIVLSNSAATDFTSLAFGGTTSSFPMFKRSGATLQVRLADDSGDAGFSVAYVKLKNTTVAGLPSCTTVGAGAMAYVTDANTPSWNATVSGGGSSKVPVVCDGTNWTVH